MTQYGINDNDIMDEVIVCDMIHADRITSDLGVGKNSWLDDSYSGYCEYGALVSELLDRECY